MSVFISLGSTPRCGSYGHSIFNILRLPQTVFPSSGAILHSHPNAWWFHFLSILTKTGYGWSLSCIPFKCCIPFHDRKGLFLELKLLTIRKNQGNKKWEVFKWCLFILESWAAWKKSEENESCQFHCPESFSCLGAFTFWGHGRPYICEQKEQHFSPCFTYSASVIPKDSLGCYQTTEHLRLLHKEMLKNASACLGDLRVPLAP